MSYRNQAYLAPLQPSLYQHTYNGATSTVSLSSVALCTLLGIAIIHQALLYLDFNVLSLSEILWNAFIFAIPIRLVQALDVRYHDNPVANSDLGINMFQNHAAKSEAMRRVLGLDRGGFLSAVGSPVRLRRLSNLVKKPTILGPAGLGNWDNSCYQNSVIQGLSALKSLPSYLDSLDAFRSLGFTSFKSPSGALQEIMRKLNDPNCNGQRLWTPSILKSMDSWNQQDAQEYFSKVLDEIDKELVKAVKLQIPSSSLAIDAEEVLGKLATVESKSQSQSIFEKHDEESREAEDLKESEESEKIAYQNLRHPLEGYIAQRVGCTRCGYTEGLSLIPFNCLTVPLGLTMDYHISECLDEYTKLELIDGVECAKCTLLQNKVQLEQLIRLPLQSAELPENEDEVPSNTNDLKGAFTERLQAVNTALEEEDFSDKAMSSKCKIPSRLRLTTTKSRQAVVARAPRCLVIHINRSVFNELTGDQMKNYAGVQFPKILDLAPWCLRAAPTADEEGNVETIEQWNLDPRTSMLTNYHEIVPTGGPMYEVRAVVTHYGRHENGHYVCYRKHPPTLASSMKSSVDADSEGKSQPPKPQDRWWRISDEDVNLVTESQVLDQAGVFMLFYEQVNPNVSISDEPSATISTSEKVPLEAIIETSTPPETDPSPINPAENEFSMPQLVPVEDDDTSTVASTDDISTSASTPPSTNSSTPILGPQSPKARGPNDCGSSKADAAATQALPPSSILAN